MNKNRIYAVIAAAFLALVAVLFFFPDDIEGNVLQQHDTMQGIANGQEGIAFHEATGQTTRWTNSLFSGMPNFQIAPSYPANKALSWIANAYMLWLPSPANILFAMMVGFFIMCLCMGLKWREALFGAVAWGFSTYFIIIIGAGHIWKFVTLAYIPPTIGGIALLYRRKYLAGTALTALFASLQLMSNHPQMTYYFLFVILALVIAWLVIAIRKHEVKQWGYASLCMVGAGLLAVAANSASLYNTLQYSKETVRGRATELSVKGGDATGGMSRDAITAWSYGIDETLTLLVPNAKGGASLKPVAGENAIKSVADTDKADDLNLMPEERMFLGQFTQYFGNQPMTNGPVYVGAFVLLLAVLAMFVVDNPVKWALFAVSILAILLSWGHNFPALTNFFIDYFPGYNKFRAVSSILVIVEFCIPLLAVLGLKKIADEPECISKNPWVFYTVFGLGALICLVGWIAPSTFGEPFSVMETEQLAAAGAFSNPAYYNVIDAIRQSRLSLVSADSLRSLCYIVLGGVILWLYVRGAFRNKNMLYLALTAVVLIDLFSINKRYVDSENFTTPVDNEVALHKTAADEAILRDTAMNYRVYDVAGMGSARSSYFHKTIGGYHAAKLTRYNDLLEHQITKGNEGVINMLNAKYLLNGENYVVNPGALGNAWWAQRLDYVANADAEMAALDSLDTRTDAVADVKFKSVLGNAIPSAPGDTIFETSYAPNRLTYSATSRRGGVAVFSEVFFPWGWTATVDGKEVPIGRVNYVLRAVRIEPGHHTVEFTFDPQSLRTTNAVSIAAVVVIYLLCIGAVVMIVLHLRKRKTDK